MKLEVDTRRKTEVNTRGQFIKWEVEMEVDTRRKTEVDTRRQMGGRNGGRHQEKNVGYIFRRIKRRKFRRI